MEAFGSLAGTYRALVAVEAVPCAMLWDRAPDPGAATLQGCRQNQQSSFLDAGGCESSSPPQRGAGVPLGSPSQQLPPFPIVTLHLPSQLLWLGASDGLLLGARCLFIQENLQRKSSSLEFPHPAQGCFSLPHCL